MKKALLAGYLARSTMGLSHRLIVLPQASEESRPKYEKGRNYVLLGSELDAKGRNTYSLYCIVEAILTVFLFKSFLLFL